MRSMRVANAVAKMPFIRRSPIVVWRRIVPYPKRHIWTATCTKLELTRPDERTFRRSEEKLERHLRLSVDRGSRRLAAQETATLFRDGFLRTTTGRGRSQPSLG